MQLKRYNALQLKELQRVHDEVKWYLGVELRRDPFLSEEDMMKVEERLAVVILNGFGKHLAQLNEKIEQQESGSQSKE